MSESIAKTGSSTRVERPQQQIAVLRAVQPQLRAAIEASKQEDSTDCVVHHTMVHKIDHTNVEMIRRDLQTMVNTCKSLKLTLSIQFDVCMPNGTQESLNMEVTNAAQQTVAQGQETTEARLDALAAEVLGDPKVSGQHSTEPTVPTHPVMGDAETQTEFRPLTPETPSKKPIANPHATSDAAKAILEKYMRRPRK